MKTYEKGKQLSFDYFCKIFIIKLYINNPILFMRYNFSLPEQEDINNFKLLAFDKDNTLTPANKPMQEKMAEFLSKITRSNKVITILTARDYEICKQHILDPMEPYDFNPKNLILGCSNGSQIYTFNEKKKDYEMSSWLVWDLEHSLSPDKIKRAIDILSVEFGHKNVLYVPRSATMWVFACLPRDVSDEERKNFDPDNSKRNRAIELLRKEKIFPESFELIAGGSISIDVGLYNKKSWMEHIIRNGKYEKNRDKVIFFWDNFDGGNDTPVESVEWISVIKVKDPDNTLEILQKLNRIE